MIHRYCDLHAECIKTKDVIKIQKTKKEINGNCKENRDETEPKNKCNHKMMMISRSIDSAMDFSFSEMFSFENNDAYAITGKLW